MRCGRVRFPPVDLDDARQRALRLHQYLIRLRRRHPWLHGATTRAVLDNRRYVYETRAGDEALLAALNIDDAPMPPPVAELTGRQARIGGHRRPARREVVDEVVAPWAGCCCVRSEGLQQFRVRVGPPP